MSPRVGLDINMIVKTAAEIADKEGLEAVTLASVARTLNVRSPSLFNHVKGLPSLKRELSLYGLKKLYEVLKNAISERKNEEAIFAMANAYLQFTREHPGIYEVTLSAPEPGDSQLQVASDDILKLLFEVLAEYKLTEEETIHAIRGLRSILHGFATLEQKGAFGLAIRLSESFQLLIEGFIASIHVPRNNKKTLL